MNTNLSYQDSVKKTSLLADRFWGDVAGDSEVIKKEKLTESFKARMEYISESKDAFFSALNPKSIHNKISSPRDRITVRIRERKP